jgi:hypothetical protein
MIDHCLLQRLPLLRLQLSRRAAEKRHELAAVHSITSSARAASAATV